MQSCKSTEIQLPICKVHVCGAIEAQDYSYQYAKYTFAKLDNNRITATSVQSTPLQSCSGTELQQQICKVTFAALHNNRNTCPDYSYKISKVHVCRAVQSQNYSQCAKYTFTELQKHGITARIMQSTRLRSWTSYKCANYTFAALNKHRIAAIYVQSICLQRCTST